MDTHHHSSGHELAPGHSLSRATDRHSHAHGHLHAHAHGAKTRRAFAIGVGLNVAFLVVELVVGLWVESLALIADAAHNVGDVAGLALAWGAAHLATRKPSVRRTYGLRRSTILASLANAVLVLVGVGAVAAEAIGRLGSAAPVPGGIIMAIAAAGVIINGGSALLFVGERKRDVNVRGAFMHLMADAAVSLGVVVAGGLIVLTGKAWIDPLVSLIVSVVIVVTTWSLLRESLDLVLDAVPEGIDPERVRTYLCGLEGVCEVHDLHIWAMSTTETALTAHLVMKDGAPPAFLRDASRHLSDDFSISHVTLQVEPHDAPEPCAHAPEDVL
ncbi:MAG: cation diffusion facilitator family transporter [Polyangiaceae bacterium]|nr:cation diffusion facilitator family transporter [Polyangiaceae bacterium]